MGLDGDLGVPLALSSLCNLVPGLVKLCPWRCISTGRFLISVFMQAPSVVLTNWDFFYSNPVQIPPFFAVNYLSSLQSDFSSPYSSYILNNRFSLYLHKLTLKIFHTMKLLRTDVNTPSFRSGRLEEWLLDNQTMLRQNCSTTFSFSRGGWIMIVFMSVYNLHTNPTINSCKKISKRVLKRGYT